MSHPDRATRGDVVTLATSGFSETAKIPLAPFGKVSDGNSLQVLRELPRESPHARRILALPLPTARQHPSHLRTSSPSTIKSPRCRPIRNTSAVSEGWSPLASAIELDSGAQCIDGAGELDECAVAGQLDQTPSVFSENRIEAVRIGSCAGAPTSRSRHAPSGGSSRQRLQQ